MDLENNDMQYAVPKPFFTATGREKLYALLSYPVAFCYVRYLIFANPAVSAWALAVFALVFCGAAMLLHPLRGAWESWVWLGCLSLCVLCPALGRDRVWEELSILFSHGFAIYFVLCRADVLLEGRTGHLLPFDAIYGAVIYPFGNFFLRARVLAAMARGGSHKARRQYLWAIPAVVAAAGLFIWITSLLSAADSGFGSLTKGLEKLWPRLLSGNCLLYFLLSLPVGAYLYGLLIGTARKTPAAVREKGSVICAALERLRKVPNIVWVLLLAAFALLYAVFFAVQGRYLFGAFTRTLPESFTVAEYARQGFFELCKVMALNLLLLWLSLRSAGASVKSNLPLKIMAAILLAEGMLFAVVAGSKLWLYIDCFGFTPLRLQSAWLICVLFAGCACAMYALWTGRRTVRAWGIFSGVSLALLCLY